MWSVIVNDSSLTHGEIDLQVLNLNQSSREEAMNK